MLLDIHMRSYLWAATAAWFTWTLPRLQQIQELVPQL